MQVPKLQCAALCLPNQTNGRFSSTSTTTTYQHHYHELKPHHFACELPRIGEVDQCWFPHEHLSIRVCGLEACAAMLSSKQVIQRSTCFRRFDILSPADSGGYAASEGDDGEALTASATAWSAPLDLWPVTFRGSLKLRRCPRTFATKSRAAAASASAA